VALEAGSPIFTFHDQFAVAPLSVRSYSVRLKRAFPSMWTGELMTLPRVMLADDHTILVEAFRKLLEPHFEIVGSVADGRALL